MAKSILSATLKKAKAGQQKQKKEAEDNTTITKRANREDTTLKKGNPLEHSNKHKPSDSPKVGMSKGVTKNMDNYESLRVDVWLSDSVREGESLKEAYSRIEATIDEVLTEAVYSSSAD